MGKVILPGRGGNKSGMNYVRIVTEGMTDHINLFWKDQIIALVPPPMSLQIALELHQEETSPTNKSLATPEGFCLDDSHRAYKMATGIDCSCPKYVRHPECDRFEIRNGLPTENPWKHP